jgi:uncharacterized protein YecE (DUF72 family)
VGCCGFAGSQARYFGLFQLVEIQSTFYQLPRPQTAERWRAVAPPGFQFAMKAWQLITHEPSSPTYRRLSRKPEAGALARYGSFRPTAEVFEAWGRTAEFARTLGTMLVVFQCPASFLPTDEHIANMRAFFGRIERSGFHLLWEPRGDWPPDTVRGMCEELDLVHCVDPFKNSPVHGAFRYFRLHGVSGYSHRYTDAELLQLKEWAGHRPAYVLFNNSAMEEDALRFLELLGGQ